LPYVLQDVLSDLLGQLYVDASNIKSKVAESGKFSIIKDNKQASKAVMKIIKKLSAIEQAIKSIAIDIDDIGVGTSTGEFHA